MGRILIALLCLCFSPAIQAETVVCFGDSLTAGTGSTPGSSYPDYLAKDLKASGYDVSLINQGVPGNTTSEGLARLQSVLALHPAIVILELGANDALLGQPVASISSHLETIIKTLQAAHVQVLLAGIQLPAHLPQGPTDAYVDQFNPMYAALSAKYKLPLVPSLLDNVYGVLDLMSSDYIHPNSRGYEHVARNVMPYLQPLLPSR